MIIGKKICHQRCGKVENNYNCWCKSYDDTGVSEDEYVMRSIKAEGAFFGDILQGSFVDSYRQSRNKTQGKEKVVVKISCQEPLVQSNPWTPLDLDQLS